MTETTTAVNETDNNETEKTPSDARIILGPLVKYAAIGLVLVSVIITTAIMLDHQLNDIDREVAVLEAELAQADSNTAINEVTDVEPAASTAPVAVTEAPAVTKQKAPDVAEVVEIAEETEIEKPVAANFEKTVKEAPVPGTAIKQADVSETRNNSPATGTAWPHDDFFYGADEFFDKSIDEIIEERNAYLRERDRIYLEEFKASQEKQLQSMRERLLRREMRIREMEKRNQELYDIRAADMIERQERRERFLSDSI